MKESDRLKLVELQNELKGSHSITTIAAAKELLDGDGECDRNLLCAKHGITASPAAFERITAVVKQLGMLELPRGALNMEDPTDSALLNDLQLLLQVRPAPRAARARERGTALAARRDERSSPSPASASVLASS